MGKNRVEYLGLKENLLGPKYEFVKNEQGNFELLGEGGSGIVFLAYQIFDDEKKISMKRAIKFFMYKEELIEKLGTYVSKENFETEISNISKFTHQNILKVIDGNTLAVTINNKIEKIPYTVTEHIEGQTLETLFYQENSDLRSLVLETEERVFDIFLQILSGIKYLHKNDFYHCDIAPKNIFLKAESDGEFLAVIGDLGAGKTLKSGENLFLNSQVIGTREYMPNNVKSKKGETICYSEFCSYQPQWDIHSTIKSFQEVITKIKEIDLFQSDLWFLDRLNETLSESTFNTIDDIFEIVDRLKPSSNQIIKLDELSEASKNIGQLLIPIYPAFLSKRMRKLAKHDMLLRLLDVPQLLEGTTTFRGANHTRYEHTLGTYELMRRSMITLLRNKDYASFFSEKNVITGLLGALLSSVSHYPYSYSINELQLQKVTEYDELNSELIFDKILNTKSKVSHKSIIDCIDELFNEYKINIEDIKYIIFGKKHRNRNKNLDILRAILSSSIGVRVIDYLMRDSHHIGLSCKIDTENLFKTLAISKSEFCITQPGIATAEKIIANRYWLFKRVYWSEPNRAYTALLKYIFYSLNIKKFIPLLQQKIPSASSTDIQKLLKSCSHTEYTNEIERSLEFINQKGQLRYKRVLALDKNSEYAHSNFICSEFSAMTYKQQYKLRKKIENRVVEEFKIEKDDIKKCGVILLIDMPYEKPGHKLGDEIRVRRYDKSFLSLNESSGIISGLRNTFEDQLMILRVFLHPTIFDKICNNSKPIEKQIREFVCECLHNEI